MSFRTFLLVTAGIAGAAPSVPAACPAFDPAGLVPGMTLADARKVLDAEEDGPEVAAVGDDFETIAHFRKRPARIDLIFPGRVTSRSKSALAAVRTCVPIATFDGSAFASRLREQFGEPTNGKSSLDAAMTGGPVTWSDPACAIDVRAWRKGDWYDPASEAWCVEQRAVRAPIASAPSAAPAVAPAAAAAAGAESAVERPAEIASSAESIPVPAPAAAPEVPAATAPVLVASVPPRYPESLRQRRLRSNVTVRATIGSNGSVDEVQVVSCDRPGFGLEDRVTAAVRQWRYRPATQFGKPVTSEIEIPFRFE